MFHTGFELFWLFFVYSLLGWVLETVVAAVKQKKFVNRGLVNSPLCVVYGVAAIVVTINGQEVNYFWLFAGSMIYATVIEWMTGHLIEKFYHERWWDYSNIKWNFDGYICLPVSLLWGTLGFAVVKWGNNFILSVYRLFPPALGKVLVWILFAILAVDILATLIIMGGKSRRMERWMAADAYLTGISERFGRWITFHVDKRIQKAYPARQKQEIVAKEDTVFAKDCDFYKVVMLFFIGAFLGDLTETIYCRITAGVWMSRSSVVWGTFSIVWGLAIAAVTAMLYKYKDKGDGFLFWMGTLLGGAYEYLCSVFTEMVFGTVFWDYSWMPFNLGGRINLLYCFFWGFAAVVWFKKLYPLTSMLIEKIPIRPGKVVTWVLIIFMTCNMMVSCMALIRYDQRTDGIPATEDWQEAMDEHFGDARMDRIYPNAKH